MAAPGLTGGDESLRSAIDLSGSMDDAVKRATHAVERLKIGDALRRATSRNEAADFLGISPRTLASKMKELGIDE